MQPEAYLQMAAVETEHWWFIGRRKLLRNAISSLKTPNNPHILEIGCGTGGNLTMLASIGQVIGVEMDPKAVEIARRRIKGNGQVFQGKFPHEIAISGKKFDVICFFDVLEHIEDDVLALEQAKSLLNDNGHIVLTVPAYPWLWSAHDVFLHHKRRYVSGEIKSKATKTGLTPLRLSHFNFILLPAMVIARLLDRLLGRRRSTGIDTPPATINRLLGFVFSLEALALRHFSVPVGASLLAILKKSR